jgi:hypothetical protein
MADDKKEFSFPDEFESFPYVKSIREGSVSFGSKGSLLAQIRVEYGIVDENHEIMFCLYLIDFSKKIDEEFYEKMSKIIEEFKSLYKEYMNIEKENNKYKSSRLKTCIIKRYFIYKKIKALILSKQIEFKEKEKLREYASSLIEMVDKFLVEYCKNILKSLNKFIDNTKILNYKDITKEQIELFFDFLEKENINFFRIYFNLDDGYREQKIKFRKKSIEVRKKEYLDFFTKVANETNDDSEKKASEDIIYKFNLILDKMLEKEKKEENN